MTNKDCDHVRAVLADFAGEKLAADERAAVQAHLAACRGCAAELDVQRALHDRLNTLQVPDPGPAFWNAFPDQVLHAYRAEQAAKPAFAARVRETLHNFFDSLQPRYLAPVAAAVLVAIGVSLFLNREQDLPPTLAFQSRIVSQQNLAVLARADQTANGVAAQFGFATGAEINFFRAGHACAEALAYSAGGDTAAARQRLAMISGLARTTGNKELADNTAALAARDALRPGDLGQLETGLTQLATARGARDRALFESGLWLVNARLALAAGDSAALRAAANELAQQLTPLESAGVAPGALRALRELTTRLAQEPLAANDRVAVRTLIRDIENILL